jgi:hypothetical protein
VTRTDGHCRQCDARGLGPGRVGRRLRVSLSCGLSLTRAEGAQAQAASQPEAAWDWGPGGQIRGSRGTRLSCYSLAGYRDSDRDRDRLGGSGPQPEAGIRVVLSSSYYEHRDIKLGDDNEFGLECRASGG